MTLEAVADYLRRRRDITISAAEVCRKHHLEFSASGFEAQAMAYDDAVKALEDFISEGGGDEV